MVEFTEEQEAEIKKRELAAINRGAEYMDRKIRTLLYFSLSNDNMRALVQRGAVDPSVLEMGQDLEDSYKELYTPKPAQPEPAPAPSTSPVTGNEDTTSD